MRVRRTALAGIVALALAAVMVALLGTPSQAEPKKLLVSNSVNGPFRDNLASPLFAGDDPFVPLDAATSTFYVKNNSKQTARTTLAVVNRGGTNEFEDALTFDVDIDGTTSSGAVPEVGANGCSLITTGPSIAPGKVQSVDVSLAVADLEGQVGMDQAASLDFVVTLSQVGPKGQVKVCGEQATAQPEVKGAQGTEGQQGEQGEQCRRDVVVTAAGTPTCVPSAVAAGVPSYGAGQPRQPATVAGLAVVLLATGAGLVLWATRRRRVG